MLSSDKDLLSACTPRRFLSSSLCCLRRVLLRFEFDAVSGRFLDGSAKSLAGDFLHDYSEDFIDVFVILRRHIVVAQSEVLRECLCFSCLNSSLVCQITFVSNKEHGDVSLAVFGDAFHPTIDVPKRLFIRDVKRNDDSLRLFVKRQRQRLKSLLSCSVPDLDLKFLVDAFGFVGFADEVKAQRCHVRR